VRLTVARRLDARDAHRALVVLGEEDAAAADVVERVRPLGLPRLAFAVGLGHLPLELRPEIAEHLLITLGCAADVHGRSAPKSR
jgi:hypothetical protein